LFYQITEKYKMKGDKIGWYFDDTKRTSGQRFYKQLCVELERLTGSSGKAGEVMLFNVSGKLSEIIKCKLQGKKVVLRLDGLYYDKLTLNFISTFGVFFKVFLNICSRINGLNVGCSHIANLVSQNYSAFARVLLADKVIYQSEFSRQLHQKYFPNKRNEVIVNGSVLRSKSKGEKRSLDKDCISLIVVYNDWKPSKRMYELVEFVYWARCERDIPLTLTILGYNGRIPKCAPDNMKTMIEENDFFITHPQFEDVSGAVAKMFIESDVYITFTNRDPCPNVVVEAMSFGIPVVAMKSGGVIDIVKDAGMLIPDEDQGDFFYSYRYDCDFPPINFDSILSSVMHLMNNYDEYSLRVMKRFEDELSINVVAKKYLHAMKEIL